jgi:hypothetical protein
MAQARFDKQGNQLPDTGRGCGCKICEESGAPRYERRSMATRAGGQWSDLRRTLSRLVTTRRQLA